MKITNSILNYDEMYKCSSDKSQWLTLNEGYHIIPYIIYTKLEKYFGCGDLDDILNYSEKTYEDMPYLYVGIEYFKENFLYIIDHYKNIRYNGRIDQLYEELVLLYKNEKMFASHFPLFENDITINFKTRSQTISFLIDYINESKDETKKLKTLYLLQNNINCLGEDCCKYLKKGNDRYAFTSRDVIVSDDPFGINQLYTCVCGLFSGNRRYYISVGEDRYLCPVCKTKLKRVK